MCYIPQRIQRIIQAFNLKGIHAHTYNIVLAALVNESTRPPQYQLSAFITFHLIQLGSQHRGKMNYFFVQLIHKSGYSEPTGRKACKLHLCALDHSAKFQSVQLQTRSSKNRVLSRLFDQVGHETTNASIGNKYFFTK